MRLLLTNSVRRLVMSSRKSFCTHEPYINIENFNVERLEATKLLGNSGRTSSARKHFAMSPPPVELLSLRGQLRDTLIKNDESMCNLGRGDLNPLDGRLFTTESVANFIRQRLSDAKDDESPFRQTLSDWYIKSLECHNAVQLVHSLIGNGEEFNEEILRILDDLDLDLMPLINDLTCFNYDIEPTDLFTSVLALSLWPQAFTYNYRVSRKVPSRIEAQFTTLVKALDTLSNDRIFLNNTLKTKCFIHDPWRRLALAKAWTHALLNGFNGRVKGWWFPIYLLHKVADSRSGVTSKSFFSKLTPSCLVDLARLMDKMLRLDPSFHRYYALYKLFEFVDHLTIDEISIVCKAFLKHNVLLAPGHPLMVSLTMSVLAKMRDSSESLQDVNVTHILDYFYQPPHPSSFDLIQAVQEQVAEKNDQLSLASLVSLLHVSTNVDSLGGNKALLNKVEAMLLRQGCKGLAIDTLLKLHRIVAMGSFQQGPQILDQIAEGAEEQLQDMYKETPLLKMLLIVQLAYEGLFKMAFFESLRNDERIGTLLDSGEFKIDPTIIYGDTLKMERQRCCLKIIHGLAELNQAEVGLRLTEASLTKLLNWNDVAQPRMFANNLASLHSIWTRVGLKVGSIVCNQVGLDQALVDKYVLETSILPFFGLTDYVFCLDISSNKVVELPQEFLNQPKNGVKRIPENFNAVAGFRWCSIVFVHSKKMALFTTQIHHPSFPYFQEAEKLGYNLSVVDIGSFQTDNEVTDVIRSAVIANLCSNAEVA